MSNTIPLDDQFEPLSDSAQLQALLERYEQWTNRDNFTEDERILLRDSICNPTKTLWLHACRKALENNNTAWLRFYQHYDGGRERTFPLSTLDWDDLEKRRTHAAVCLANCALAATVLETATPDAVSQFVASFENALIHWQASGNSKNTIPLRSQSPPPLLAIDSFLEEIKRLYASANEEFEVSPVETLIRHFLRIDSHRFQAHSKTALFPLVFRVGGNAIALFEVDRYDHGTGRLYRDAVTSAFVVADDEFYESLQTAFEYIKNQNGDVENYDFYWRVRIWNRKTSGSLVGSRLLKQSAGLAATIAVNDSIRNSDLGAGYLFTGKVNRDGTFGVVGDLQEKINLAESNDLPIFIPRITDSNGVATRIASRSDKVRLANSFVDVTQIIQSERQALKEENDRRLRRRRRIKIAIVASILLAGILTTLFAWGYSLEKKRGELAEFEKNIAERETEELKVARQALDTKNAELNDANALLDKANEELDSKNRKLTRTNAALEAATNEAVASEQEAQKLRQIAQASKQAAIASQFATEGYKRLVDGDKSGAQSYFAKALTFDDQEGYRTGLLNAYFDSGISSYRLAWSFDFGQSACCLKTAMSHSGAFLATTTLDRMQVRIIKTGDGSQVSTVRLPKRIADIALSTNGEMLAAKADDGQVSVWKTGSQEKILEYSAQPDESHNSLVFSNDSIYLAVVSGAHSVLVTEIASGKIVKHFDNPENLGDAKISYVSFIPGNYVVYSFRYGPIIIASVKNAVAPTRINAWNYHLGLGYTQRGELITSAADITVYPDITNKLGSVTLPDFDSINQRVRNDWLIGSNSSIPYYSTTNDNGIIHIRMGSEVVGQIAFPMGKPVNLMLGSNGNLLFQNYEGKVFCWTPTPSNFKRFGNDDLGHEYGFFRRFRQEGNKLLVEDAKSRSVVFSLVLQVPEGRRPVAVTSENGRYLAVSEDSQSVDIYDSENGAKKHHFELNVESDKKQIYQMAVSNDARKIAVAWPNSINVISAKANEILGTVKFPLSFSEHFYFDSLTFSPQDAFLIVQTENSINLFDTSNCNLRHSIPFHQSGCYPEGTSCSWFALSNDEKFVALTNKSTGLVYIWNLDGTRHLVDVIETGSKSPELAVGAAFTSDNHYFVWSSGNSGRIHSYDLRRNRTLPDFLMDEGIENLLISKTNQLLIKGLQENYATDWNNLIYLMTASPSDINSNIATKTGFRIASSETALYSQEQLEQLLSNSRPTNQLLAVDRNGSDIQSFEMFGPTQVRRPPIRPIQSLPSKNNGRATTAVLTTPRAPNQKPTESKGMVCPTGFAMPVFNPFPIAFDSENAPLCSDLPLLDVAEDTVYPKFSESMDQYLSTRRFPGAKRLVALLYMDNGGYSRPVSYVAKNVKISTAIERSGNVYKLTARYTGDNVAPASASISIEVDPDERLEVIPNSGFMYTWLGELILDRQRLDLGNSTFALGDLDPDWQYSLFFSYKIAITKR